MLFAQLCSQRLQKDIGLRPAYTWCGKYKGCECASINPIYPLENNATSASSSSMTCDGQSIKTSSSTNHEHPENLRLRNSLSSSAMACLYCTYIPLKLEYACITLCPVPTHTLDRLDHFQCKAARVWLLLPLCIPVDHTTFFIDLTILQSIVIGILNTSLHTPYITVMPLRTPCSWTSFHPLHLTTLYVIDVPTIYLAPVLTVTKTPSYINHFTSLIHCLKTLKKNTTQSCPIQIPDLCSL